MAKGSFLPNGYRLIRSALTINECDALLEAATEWGCQNISMPHDKHPAFRLGMRTLKPLAQTILGPAVSGLGSDFWGTSAGLGTHRDNDTVLALPGTLVSIWCALADVTMGNGPLAFGREVVLCQKGDAILIDGDAPHRSCAGHGPRPVALFTYIVSGAPFRPGNTQHRREVQL